MSDQWADIYRHPQDPATSAVAITPGPAELAQPTRGIHASTDGDITVTMLDGQSVSFTVKAGFLYPYRIKKCTAATATIVGVY